MLENTDRHICLISICIYLMSFLFVRVNFTFMWSPEINFLDFIKVKEQIWKIWTKLLRIEFSIFFWSFCWQLWFQFAGNEIFDVVTRGASVFKVNVLGVCYFQFFPFALILKCHWKILFQHFSKIDNKLLLIKRFKFKLSNVGLII